MPKIRIVMPESAGMTGNQDKELEVVPHVGDYIKDANNRYYRVIAVVHQPFERLDFEPPPQIEVRLTKDCVTAPE